MNIFIWNGLNVFALAQEKMEEMWKDPLRKPNANFSATLVELKEKKWKSHLTTSVSQKAAIQKDSAAHQEDVLSSSD